MPKYINTIYLKHIFDFTLLQIVLFSLFDGDELANGVSASSLYKRNLTVSAAILKNITASS